MTNSWPRSPVTHWLLLADHQALCPSVPVRCPAVRPLSPTVHTELTVSVSHRSLQLRSLIVIHKHTPQTIIHTACLSLCHWEFIKSLLLLMGCSVRHDSSSRIYPTKSESHKQTTLTYAKIIPKILKIQKITKISKKSQRSQKNPKISKNLKDLLRKKSLIKPPLMSTNRVYIPDSLILPHTNAVISSSQNQRF